VPWKLYRSAKRSLFWTSSSDTDCILTFSLGLFVPTLRRFCRLTSTIWWYDTIQYVILWCIMIYLYYMIYLYLLQHEGSETRGYCVYDITWINPLRIKVRCYTTLQFAWTPVDIRIFSTQLRHLILWKVLQRSLFVCPMHCIAALDRI